MTELGKVLNALENCTAHQKCRDCGWEECEHEHETIEIPLTLAKDAMKLLREQKKRIEELESEKRWEEYPDTMGRW